MKTNELIAMAAKTAAEIQERKQAQLDARMQAEAEEKAQAEFEMQRRQQAQAEFELKQRQQAQAEFEVQQRQQAQAAMQPVAQTAGAPVQKTVSAPPLETPQTPVPALAPQPVQTAPQAATAAPAPLAAPAPTQPAPQPAVQRQQPEPQAHPQPQQKPQPKTEVAPIAPVAAAAAAASLAVSDSGAPTQTPASWQDGLPTGNRKVVSKGLTFIFGFLGLFLLWAFLFPISSAVVAPGKIVSAGSNKLIQHPVGGVVREIFVRDGEAVEQGQVIMTLDPSINQAELTRLSARQRMLQAMQARLTSSEGEGGFAQPEGELQLRGSQSGGVDSPAAVDPLLEQQRREFEAGRKRLAAEIDAAASQIEALKDERSGFQARLAGEQRLLNFSNMEIGKVRPLANEGLLPKARLWDLEKKRLEQVTAVSNLEATIDSTTQRIAEAEAQLAQLSEADREKRSEELTKVIGELGEIKDQILAARVSLNSTELKAPAAGVLTKMTANTVGGVIRSGDPIAEIVPGTSDLITEFRVPLDKVKSVQVGQKARIVVTAFNRRTYDPIEGEVIYVSADSEIDQATQETFFVARARLNENPDKNNGIGEVQAGMPTEVYALSSPRVFMSYVFQPVYDSFDKAFRETN